MKKKVISFLVALALLAVLGVLVAKYGYVEKDDASSGEITTQTKEPITEPVLILSSEDSVGWKTEQYCTDMESQFYVHLYYFPVELEGYRTYKLKLRLDSDAILEDGVYGVEKFGIRLFGEYYWSEYFNSSDLIIEKGKPDHYDTEITFYFTLKGLPDDKTVVNFYTHGSYDVECFSDLHPDDVDILSFELYCVQ